MMTRAIDGDREETISENPRSWIAWKREAERQEAVRRRMVHILAEMTLERTGWRALFSRWRFSHEPLRHDAANLLAEIGYSPIYPVDSRPLPPLSE